MSEKFAFVTGASSGIGFSLAKELADRGYDLAICSSGQRLDVAAADLQRVGARVFPIQADLATRLADLEAVIDAAGLTDLTLVGGQSLAAGGVTGGGVVSSTTAAPPTDAKAASTTGLNDDSVVNVLSTPWP